MPNPALFTRMSTSASSSLIRAASRSRSSPTARSAPTATACSPPPNCAHNFCSRSARRSPATRSPPQPLTACRQPEINLLWTGLTYASTRLGPTSSIEKRPLPSAAHGASGQRREFVGDVSPFACSAIRRMLSRPVVTGAMATRSGSRRPRPRLRAHRRRLVPPEPHRRQRALPSCRRRFRGWPMTWAAPG